MGNRLIVPTTEEYVEKEIKKKLGEPPKVAPKQKVPYAWMSTPKYSPPVSQAPKIKPKPSPQETATTKQIIAVEERKADIRRLESKRRAAEEMALARGTKSGEMQVLRGYGQTYAPFVVPIISQRHRESLVEHTRKYPLDVYAKTTTGIVTAPVSAGVGLVGKYREGKGGEALGNILGIGSQTVVFYGGAKITGKVIGKVKGKVAPREKVFMPTEYEKFEYSGAFVGEGKPAIKTTQVGVTYQQKTIPIKEFKTMVKTKEIKGYTYVRPGKGVTPDYVDLPVVAGGAQATYYGDVVGAEVAGFERLITAPSIKKTSQSFKWKTLESTKTKPFKPTTMTYEPVSPGAKARADLFMGRSAGIKQPKTTTITKMSTTPISGLKPAQPVTMGPVPYDYNFQAVGIGFGKIGTTQKLEPTPKMVYEPKIRTGTMKTTIGRDMIQPRKATTRTMEGFDFPKRAVPKVKTPIKTAPRINIGQAVSPRQDQKIIPQAMPKFRFGEQPKRPRTRRGPPIGAIPFMSMVPETTRTRRRKKQKDPVIFGRGFKYAPSLVGTLKGPVFKMPKTLAGLRPRPVVKRRGK